MLLSIQSLILVDKPYFNEPSYEASIGTPHGDEASRQYNMPVRENNIRYVWGSRPPTVLHGGWHGVGESGGAYKRQALLYCMEGGTVRGGGASERYGGAGDEGGGTVWGVRYGD